MFKVPEKLPTNDSEIASLIEYSLNYVKSKAVRDYEIDSSDHLSQPPVIRRVVNYLNEHDVCIIRDSHTSDRLYTTYRYSERDLDISADATNGVVTEFVLQLDNYTIGDQTYVTVQYKVAMGGDSRSKVIRIRKKPQ